MTELSVKILRSWLDDDIDIQLFVCRKLCGPKKVPAPSLETISNYRVAYFASNSPSKPTMIQIIDLITEEKPSTGYHS
jgi:hypothetical protein